MLEWDVGLRKIVIETLDKTFPSPPIPLHHESAYTLLIAVLLSAQCTDERVNGVTPYLFEKATTPEAMLRLGEDGVRAIIKPCGFYRVKAKHIQDLSRILVERYEGQVPASFEALEQLPGVGHKTASVVMGQWFGAETFPVDTHIYRLARRWGISKESDIRKVEADLKAFFPRETWNKVHLQMIYFGRRYCKARGHRIEDCPLCALVEKYLTALT